MRTVLVFLLAALGLLPSSSAAAGVTLEVHDAWIREAPPTTRVLAAYMLISNTGESPAEITSIASPDFEHTELHRTIVESGVARMAPIESLEIPAGEKISLEPGGIHLMLINPLRPLHEGDTVTLIIHRADEIYNTFPVAVVRATGETAHQHH
jgi:copper(I)-binding protein